MHDLLGYGRRLRHRSAAWLALTSLAVAAFVLALLGVAVAASTYEGRVMRTAARRPTLTDVPAQATFRYAPSPARPALQQVWVFYVTPTTDDAMPPPGVDKWPQPGEAVVSPALSAAMGDAESWSSWHPGTVIGIIRSEALASPSEMIAYVNPPRGVRASRDDWSFGSSFGSSLVGPGEVNSIYPLPAFLLLYFPAVVVPATFLLVGTWLAGANQRRRTDRILALLGVRSAERLALRFVAAAPAWALGSTIAAGVVCLMVASGLSLPYVGYLVQSVDVRSGGVMLALVWLGASATSLVLLVSAPLQRGRSPSRRVNRLNWPQVTIATLSLFCVCAGIPLISALSPSPWLRVYLSMAVLLTVVVTMPALCSVTLGLITRMLRRTESVGATVGLGLLRQSRGPAVALAGTFGVALCLLSVVNVYITNASEPFPEARPIYQGSIGKVISVSSNRLDLSTLTPARWTALTDSADTVVLAAEDRNASDQPWQLFATPHALQGEPSATGCRYSADTPTALQNALAELFDTTCPKPLSQRPRSGTSWQLILYRAQDGSLDPSDTAELLSTWFAPPPNVEVPGSYWLSGGLFAAAQSRWITFCASIGLMLTMGALLQFAAADLEQARRRIAGYLILGADDALPLQAMTWRLGLPVAIALSYSLVFSLQRLMVSPDLEPAYSIEPFLIYATALIIGMITAIGMNARGARLYLPTWRPGRGRE